MAAEMAVARFFFVAPFVPTCADARFEIVSDGAPLDFIHIICTQVLMPYQKIYLFYLAHAQRIFSSLLFVGLPHHSH